jgi:pimeloyl-ACP methyl ester carboxylesterase
MRRLAERPLLNITVSLGLRACYVTLTIPRNREVEVDQSWRREGPHLTAVALDCGHFLAEEQPEEVAQRLRSFTSSH